MKASLPFPSTMTPYPKTHPKEEHTMPICAKKKIPWTPEKPGGGVFWGSCRLVDLEAGILVTTNRTKAQSGGGSWPFGEKSPPPSPLFPFGVFWLNIESERWLPGEPTVTSSPLPFFSPPAIHAPPPPLFQWRWLWVLISGNLWVCPAWKLRVRSKPVPLPMQEGSVPQMIACLH